MKYQRQDNGRIDMQPQLRDALCYSNLTQKTAGNSSGGSICLQVHEMSLERPSHKDNNVEEVIVCWWSNIGIAYM